MVEQQRLAFHNQNSYAENGGNPMVDGVATAERPASILKEEQRTKQADWAKREKAEKEKRQRERRTQKPKEMLVDPRSGNKVAIETRRELKEFFQLINANPERVNPTHIVNLNDDALKENYKAYTRLTKRYDPGPDGEDLALDYYRMLYREVVRRKLDPIKLAEEAMVDMTGAGPGAEAVEFNQIEDEYTDEILKLIVDEINTEIARREAEVAGTEQQPKALNTRLLEPLVERVRTRMNEEAAARDEGRRLLSTINEYIEEAEREYRRSSPTRPGRGWSGERILTDKELEGIDADINALVSKAEAILAGDPTRSKFLAGAELKGETLDKLFNRIFDQANVLPREVFNEALGSAGSKEKLDFTQDLYIKQGEALDTWQSTGDARMKVRADVIEQLIHKYGEEFTLRESLHNVYWIAETEGEFKQFAEFCTKFASHFLDQAFLDSPEVEAALRIRENVLYQIKAENNGRLPPEKVIYNPRPGGSEWEFRSKRMLEQMYTAGIFNETVPNGTVVELPAWKIARALSLSRGLGMVLLRWPEISAETVLGASGSTNQAQPSIPWEKLAWDLNPMDHKIKRYAIGQNLRAILYAAKERSSKGILDFWNQDELRHAVDLDLISVLGNMHGDIRIVDWQNLFRTGGPASTTGWRPYTAALDEMRDKLRPLLKRNPGLAMNMLFNRYERLNMSEERLRISNLGLHEDDRLKQWNKYKKENEKQAGEDWAANEKLFWQQAADRIPHVVYRLITDKANFVLKPDEYGNFYERVCSLVGERLSDKDIMELNEDLTIAKENLMIRRKNALRGAITREEERDEAFYERRFPKEQDMLLDEDFNRIDEARRERAKRFRNAIVEVMKDTKIQDKVFKAVKDRNFSFAVSGEDVPWGEFYFAQSGPRGYITRKVNDAFSVSAASDEMVSLIKHLPDFKGPEDIIEQFKKIFFNAEIYDRDVAREAIKTLSIGVIRFYEKDGILKIPIFGEAMMVVNGMRDRGNSFAQTEYGDRAQAWDSDDIYNFTEQLRSILTLEQVQAIRKETGGTIWHALGRKTKIAFYLMLLFASYEMMEKLLSEK